MYTYVQNRINFWSNKDVGNCHTNKLHFTSYKQVIDRTFGMFKVMKLLIDFGVDLDARDQDGKTPLHVAAE